MHAMDSFFDAMIVGETGSVQSREEWPRPLLELIDECDEVAVTESNVQVFCLCQGFDPEYVWRMTGDETVLQLLKDKWQLSVDEKPRWHVLRGYSQNSEVSVPPWWSPKENEQTTFYVCPQAIAKDKGDRFKVAFDASRQSIFVHYWSNF